MFLRIKITREKALLLIKISLLSLNSLRNNKNKKKETLIRKKIKSSRKFFPGYVLVEMNMKKNLWYLIKRIPGVLDFIGGSPEKPIPINEKEINNILFRLKNAVDKPKPKILFEPGEIIRVVDGPFSDFNGSLEEVNYDKNRLKVSVMIFGRSTPVDLDFSQVEKV
jgi:transcriptional antiterminator NusG